MIVTMRIKYPDHTGTWGKIVLERDDPQFGPIAAVVFENSDHNRVVGAKAGIEAALRFMGAAIQEGRLY